MIYVLYLLTAAVVVILSSKASEYVDIIDKKTDLSGAFIGGVMLSAVTSLPELFTSLSATIFLNKSGLCIGNIMGSDLFNLAVLAFFMLMFFKPFKSVDIAKSHIKVNIFVILIYIAVVLNMLNILNIQIFTVNVTSLIIIVLYIFGIKFMSSDESEKDDEDNCALTLKQVVFRFILVSIGIVAVSIIITFITDNIAERLNLGAGLAGALFLGIATSLPELASTAALFKIKNYNIAIGNIIGSNLFNFVILSVADIVYLGGGIYDFSDPKTINMIVFGGFASILALALFKFKNKMTGILCPIGILMCYAAFLIVG